MLGERFQRWFTGPVSRLAFDLLVMYTLSQERHCQWWASSTYRSVVDLWRECRIVPREVSLPPSPPAGPPLFFEMFV